MDDTEYMVWEDGFYADEYTHEEAKFAQQQENMMNGQGLPIMTDTATGSPSSDLLKQMGGIISNAPTIARDLGTVVGTIQQQAGQLGGIFKTAQNNAATGNKLGQWFQYASTTDKLVVGLAAATLLYMIVK